MSLTKNDIQIIREAFQPQFDRIDKRFEQIDQRFESIDKRIEDIDTRFVASFAHLDSRITQLEDGLSSICRTIVDELYEMYAPREEFDTLEKRVDTVEKKLHKHSF